MTVISKPQSPHLETDKRKGVPQQDMNKERQSTSPGSGRGANLTNADRAKGGRYSHDNH